MCKFAYIEGIQWIRMDEYVSKLNDSQIIEIYGAIGPLPDLSRFTRMRKLCLTRCIITEVAAPLPDWIEHLSIYHANIGELPARLPLKLKRICVEHSDIKRLPVLPTTVVECCVANNPNLVELASPLPPNLTQLLCARNRIRALPALPDKLYILSCHTNALHDLPVLPAQIIYVEVIGNPLGHMPIQYPEMTMIEDIIPPRQGLLKRQIQYVNAIHQFRRTYSYAKFGGRFRTCLWKIRERNARRQCDPVYLAKCLEHIPEDMLDYATDLIFGFNADLALLADKLGDKLGNGGGTTTITPAMDVLMALTEESRRRI